MEQHRLSEKRVLIVEDERSARESIKLLLRIDRYAVTEATDGPEALDLVSRQAFDLVILDYVLPGMQGEEIARRIMRIAPALPILMVTAHAEKLRATDMPGVSAILGKPFAVEELRGVVARLVS